MIDYRKVRFALQEFKRLYKEDHVHYQEFLDLKTVIGLYWWIRHEKKYNLAELRAKGKPAEWKAPSQRDAFCLMLEGMNHEERALIVKALNRYKSLNAFHSGNEAVKVMFEETEAFLKDNPDGILVFRGTLQNYMAVGRCADILFERLGWQTSTVVYENCAYSCMMLNECSLEVIKNGMALTVSKTQLDFDYMAFEDEDCVTFALQQMMIDFVRLVIGEHDIIHPTLGFLDPHVIVDEQGIENEVRFPFFELTSEKFCLFSSKGMPYLVVSDHTWDIELSALRLLGLLADMLYFLLEWHEGRCDMIGHAIKVLSVLCMKDYFEKKEKYPENVLIVDYNGVYECYDHDAEWLSGKFNIPLWDRYIDEGQCWPMVMMSEKDVNRIMRRCANVMLESSSIPDSEDKMLLLPNRMNCGVIDETNYKKVAVFKRKDGKYVIRASLNGKELTPKVLDKKLTQLYVSYEKNGLKDLVLKQILWYVYTLRTGRRRKRQ